MSPPLTASTARQKEIFLAAREIAGAAERGRFLDEACGGEAALRGRIEQLLRLDAETSTDFLAPATAPLPAVPHAGETIGYFGDYVLLDEIARGSAGVVFRARQTSLNRVVALKMLRDRPLLTSDADTKRFRAEAEAAASLDHPHIVPIYEVGAHEGQAYFSMKLVEGGTLHFRAAEFQRDPRKAAALMATVARAVHHAHQHGILHRDLKPGNILLDAAGTPLVTDFGLARKIGLDSTLTMSGQIMGTPHYMAPEQARGENRALTPAADIYSLGAMLYELLAGRRAFDGEDFIALLKQVAEAAPPPLRSVKPSLDRDLETVVMKCLEKAPAARYATAAELADDLDRWRRGEPVRARPAGAVRRTFKWMRRHRAGAALWALGLAGAGWGLASLWPQSTGGGDGRDETASQAGHRALAEAADDPNRRAALWLFHYGGSVQFRPVSSTGNSPYISASSPAQLPDQPFVITWLELDYLHKKNPAPPAPAGWSALRGLRGLDLVLIRNVPVTEDALLFLKDCPQLRWLQLTGLAGFTDDMLEVVGSLPVKHLELTYFPDLSTAAICRMPNASRIEALNFSHTAFTDETLPLLAAFSSARELAVEGIHAITDAGLAGLAAMPALEHLNLGVCPGITGASFASFPAADRLRYLRLVSTGLTDAGCAAIATGLPALEHLVVSDTRITDAGFASLAGLKHLRVLEAAALKVTDTGLAALHAVSTLQLLEIRETAISPAAVAALKAAVPGCEVRWSGTE